MYLGYSLSKQDFRNAINLRYGWDIPGIHSNCACGSKNSIDHALICKKGGYVSYRHDVLVETEAEFLREAKCKNVYTEPALLPTVPELHPKGTSTAEGARLDIVATGLFGPTEKAFMDVRITHPGAPSNKKYALDKLLSKNEQEKKLKYNSRVINTEKSTFIPLVFTTGGATAPECQRFHKQIAEKIARRRKEEYSHVMSYIRTKTSFALLRSILLSLHGVRTNDKKTGRFTTPVSDVAFGLVPQEMEYEA